MTTSELGQMHMINVPDHWAVEPAPVANDEASQKARRILEDISVQAAIHGSQVATTELENFLLDKDHDHVGIIKPFVGEDGVEGEGTIRIIELHRPIDGRIIVFTHTSSDDNRTYGIITGNVFTAMSLTGIYREYSHDELGDDNGKMTISRMFHGLREAIELADAGLPV